MRRRTLLHTAAAALTIGFAGCNDGGDTPTPTGPGSATSTQTPASSNPVLAPIRDLWSAYNNENAAGVAAVFHPDAENPPEEDSVTFRGEVTINELTVTDRSDGEATVVGNLTLTGEYGSETQEQTYELRRADGEWRILSLETQTTSDDESRPELPQVAFEFDYDDSGTADETTGVVTITHTGGDNVDAADLFVRGDGIIATADANPNVTVSNTSWADATGIGRVAAGDEVTVGATGDCELRVEWDDGESSATLAEFEGPDA